MYEFVRRVGLEDSLGGHEGPQFIHVAGTNGKGSVTAFLQSMLVESKYRTGAFFSPYVFDPRERVQFGRESISKEDLADLTTILKPIGESLSSTEFGGVTEFEFKTALGFLYWKVRTAEWVALEVGLGGRLDATNVVTPRASVIVSIGLDHTAILGDTHAKIAYEKAGVIKPGVPVIVGALSPEAMAVVADVAKEAQAPVWRWNKEVIARPDKVNGEIIVETPLAEHHGLLIGIPGALQGHNLALAVAAMDAAGATKTLQGMQIGARRATIPGRFQVVEWKGRTIILDGAHNADAAAVLKESLSQYFWSRSESDVKSKPQVIMLTGMVSGHDAVSFYAPLAGTVSSAHIVPIDFHRAVSPNEIAAQISSLISSTAHSSIAEGLDIALKECGPEDVIVVTGSFYLVGEVARFIGLT